MNGLFGIWCKLCELAKIVAMLCDNLSTIVSNNELISNSNVEIKDKIVALVGDPNAPCPECPPPGEEVIAAMEDTTAAQAVTTMMQEQTAALIVKATAVKTALGRTTEGKAAAEGEG